MGFQAWMTFANEKSATNALVFATREEADAFGADLLSRWLYPIGCEVRECDQEPNYRWIEGEGLQRIGSDEPPRMPPARVTL